MAPSLNPLERALQRIVVELGGANRSEQLVCHLQNRGYVVRMLLEREDSGRISTVRLTRDSERAIYVDLLFASSGIEAEIVNAAEPIDIVEGISVPVASRAHLIALKILARDDRNRPQDWDDLRALLLDASQQDLRMAREALHLIEQRGYNRGRALDVALDHALEDTM